MHIEGIVIQKTPYKERDLICNVLLRSGKKVALYFYGGRGGGKKAKGSIIEVGHMLSMELATQRKKIESDIRIVKEYKLLWSGEKVRDDFKAFYLITFFLEVMGKISIDENLEHPEEDEHAGLFNVLSNSLFFVNKSLENGDFELNTHLFFFLTKLSVQLGIVPELDNCLFCNVEYRESDLCIFESQNGGFVCTECASKQDEFLSQNKLRMEEFQNSRLLRLALKQVYKTPYKEYGNIQEITHGLTVAAFNYLNFQFEFTQDQYKSWSMISSF